METKPTSESYTSSIEKEVEVKVVVTATPVPPTATQPLSIPETPRTTPIVQPTRIAFEPGATSATIAGNLAAQSSAHYVIRAMAGQLQGERRSPKRGQSVEFADFRPYAPGDDFRRIDWNAYARLERFFLKLFHCLVSL